MFRNILVALDDSPTAQRALSEATDLAQALNASLTIIAVAPAVPPVAYRAGVDIAALEREVEQETDQILRDAVEALPESLPVTKVLKHGHPGEEIVKQIESGDHDLVAMGSRGRGRVSANLLGSVGGYVHYHSNVAMLVIHPQD